MDTFIYRYDLLAPKTIKELDELIMTKGRVFGLIPIKEFVINNANGIYVFINSSGKIMYVGRAGSRPFLERFGGHLDIRTYGRFNNLIKTISDKDSCSLPKAAEKLFDFRVLLITMPDDDKITMNKLEKVLQRKYSPQYCKQKIKPINLNNDTTLEQALKG